MIKAIFAMDLTGGIGYKNALPWGHNSTDLAYFKKITDSHIVVMGRKTWDSLPDSVKPLPGRANYVVSSSVIAGGAITIHPDALIKSLNSLSTQDKDVFIIGGKQLLESTIHLVDSLFVTEISGRYMSDVVINKDIIFDSMYKTSTREDGKCTFNHYSRVHKEKEEEIVNKPINHGSTLSLRK